ncbi:MAG: hypothetical protein RLZZ546_3307, partial [Bacteroidota bacterium]
MHLVKRLFGFIMFFAICNYYSIYSQTDSISIDTLNVIDGLSSSSTTKIFKDRNDFIWIATNNGLNHYDGHSFTHIEQGKKEGQIFGNNIITLDAFDDDHLIIGTNLGVSIINIFTFETENILINNSPQAKYKDNFVVEVLPSENKSGFWVLTFKEILYFDRFQKLFTHRLNLPIDNKDHFTYLSSPRMAELGADKLLFMVPQNTNSIINNKIYECDIKVKSLSERKFSFLTTTQRFSGLTKIKGTDILFIEDAEEGIKTHIWNLKSETHKTIPFDGKSKPYFYNMFFRLTNNQLAISIYEEPYYYLLSKDITKWEKVKIQSSAFIKGQLDINDKLSYQLGYLGILKINKKKTNTYQSLYKKTKELFQWNGYIASFNVNDSLRCFIQQNTSKALIFNFIKNTWQIRIIKNLGKGNYVIDACIFEEGKSILLGTNIGLRILDFNSFKATSFPKFENINEEVNSAFMQIFGNNFGKIWVKKAISKTFYEINVKQKVINSYTDSLVEGLFYNACTFDNELNLYFISPQAEGILKFDKQNKIFSKIYPKTTDENYFFNIIRIAFDKMDNLWIFTNGFGIFQVEKNTFKVLSHYGTPEGLSSDYIVSALKDANNNFWIKTIKGFHYLDSKSKAITNISNVSFSNADMAFRTMNEEKSYVMIAKKGDVMVDHIDSLTRLRTPLPIDVFKGLWKGNFLKIDKDKKIEIDQKYNSITLYFRSQNYEDGSENKYYYRLLPNEDLWVEVPKGNKIQLNHIGPGNNKLEMKLCYTNGQCFEQKCLEIDVPYYLWQRWWFWPIIFSLILGALFRYYFVEFKNRKILLEKSQAELKFLQSKMNPHFIYNALNSINRYILKEEKITASEYLSKFSKLMRTTLDNSNKMFLPLDKEIESLHQYLGLEALRFQQKFDYEIVIDSKIQRDKIKIPPMLIQPFVENAI